MVGIMSQVFSLVVLLLISFPLHETFHLHTGWFGIVGCFSHLCFFVHCAMDFLWPRISLSPMTTIHIV
jgi:hypothetical protein